VPELHVAYTRLRRWGATASIAASLLLAAARSVAGQGGVVRSDTGRMGSIVGTVRDGAGTPVTGARVEVAPDLSTVTDSLGVFSLRGLPVGVIVVRVRRVGFAPLASQWDMGPYTLTLDLRMRANPVVLPVVRAQAKPEVFDARLAGFYARRSKKLGYYLTRDDFDRGQSFLMTEALQRLPGVQPYNMRDALGTTVRLAGQACPPLVMVDGFPAALGHFDLNMLDLSTVEGVEVYPHGSSIPAALAGPYGMENCGLIAIWSRPMRPNVRANQLPPEHPPNLDSLLAANVVYTPATVDVPAEYESGTGSPGYPDSLLRARIAGKVQVRFVVDSTGAVELPTVNLVSATDSLFGAAVRNALAEARFRPAKLGGRAVRQIVEMPFEFQPPPPDSAGRLRVGGGKRR
jgi:TonB family protein